MKKLSGRFLGAVALLAGVVVAFETRSFSVGFMTDPVGPKGFPLLVASFFLVGGMWLLFKPGVPATIPSRSVLVRQGVAIITLFVYAILQPILGFVVSTWGAIAVLGRVFGGTWVRAVLYAFVFAVACFVLFTLVLQLPLPIGTLWLKAG